MIFDVSLFSSVSFCPSLLTHVRWPLTKYGDVHFVDQGMLQVRRFARSLVLHLVGRLDAFNRIKLDKAVFPTSFGRQFVGTCRVGRNWKSQTEGADAEDVPASGAVQWLKEMLENELTPDVMAYTASWLQLLARQL